MQERFQRVIPGPLVICIGEREFDLPISCALSTDSRIYLIVACRHAEVASAGQVAQEIYSALRRHKIWNFRLFDGRGVTIRKADGQAPTTREFGILLVPTQSGTAFGFLDSPKRPVRLMPLADLITIFDALHYVDELERFWIYVDGQRKTLSPFSQALADLFASFRDTHEVLIDGAVTPTYMVLDTQWGSSWRYRELSNFWANAPRRFPDESTGWLPERLEKGVIQMRSRHHSVLAYSVEVADCTVQALMNISTGMVLKDGQMVDLFIQVLSDCLQECRDLVSELPLFHRPHMVVWCEADPAFTIDESKPSEVPDPGTAIVTLGSKVSDNPLTIRLHVNVLAVLAGLTDAADASFEVECLLEGLVALLRAFGGQLPDCIADELRATATRPARYHLKVAQRVVDVPEFVDPVVPSPTQYKLARRQLAVSLQQLGLAPGRYELADAKERIDVGREQLRLHIERRLEKLDARALVRCCIEQHDALLASHRMRIERVRQSLAHEVDYDRLETVAEAQEKYLTPACHYRYLLEKVLSSAHRNVGRPVDAAVLRELVGLVDWHMVLAAASDALHNEVDAAGVQIDDFYVPEVFYSADWKSRESVFGREYAQASLGLGISDTDVVEGDLAELLASEELREAFLQDLGFELKHLLQSLAVLTQPVGHELSTGLALSYVSPARRIQEAIKDSVEGVADREATAIIQFLTLSARDIRRLPGRTRDEGDVPFWEHSKRLQRYAIRPLVPEGEQLCWGAEQAYRAMRIWMKTVRDGYLPAQLPCRRIVTAVSKIKNSIEKQLEIRTEQICLRFTPHVVRGVDFFRRFRGGRFRGCRGF